MKKYVDLSNAEFSDKEYSALREEISQRMNIVYNHGFTLASIILVFFSATLVFVGKIIEIAMSAGSIFGSTLFFDLSVVLAIAAFSGFPVLLVNRYSVKYEENLRQICNISAYQKIYYEYPSMLKRSESGKILGWELLECNAEKKDTKVIGSEYVAISIMSLVLYVALSIALGICACIPQRTNWFSCEKAVASTIALCLFIAATVAIFVFYIRLTMKTSHNTNSEKIVEKYAMPYLEIHLQTAVDSGFLNEEEADNFQKFYHELSERDKTNDIS